MARARNRRRLEGLGWGGWTRLGFLLLFLIPASCAEDENPLGFDGGSRGDPLVAAETLLIAQPDADVVTRPPRSTGSSLSILVGADDEATARGYLRFGTLPDTTGLAFAYLQLHAKRGLGDRVELVAKRVIGDAESWTPSELTWETQPAVDEVPLDTPRPVHAGTLGASEIDTIPRIGIPFSLIKFWKEYPDSNAGLALTAASEPESDGIARIVSSNDVIFSNAGASLPTPTLILASSTGDQFEVQATSDAYVVLDKREAPTGSDSLATVSAGAPRRFHLGFDLTTVPEDASIVRATLDLPLAPGYPSDTLRLALYETTEAWEEATPPDSLDTAASPVFVDTFDDMSATSYRMELGRLVQEWLKGRENFGVTVRFADETAAPQSVDFLTGDAVSRQPSLQLIYLRPLEYRWGKSK